MKSWKREKTVQGGVYFTNSTVQDIVLGLLHLTTSKAGDWFDQILPWMTEVAHSCVMSLAQPMGNCDTNVIESGYIETAFILKAKHRFTVHQRSAQLLWDISLDCCSVITYLGGMMGANLIMDVPLIIQKCLEMAIWCPLRQHKADGKCVNWLSGVGAYDKFSISV